MRSRFDEQLTLLNTELIKMGALCEDAIRCCAKALMETDLELAKTIPPMEAAIDTKEKEIESLCLKLLLQQQPVAKDLRIISAALKMITDLERIGDQARDIGEIIHYLTGHTTIKEFQLIQEMANATIKMVTKSIDAFVSSDEALAKKVIASDDEVDNLFIQIKSSLISLIQENPEKGEAVIDLLMIAKYFERIGDHAVNVAEWVVFSITGIHKGELP